jgi:hypothetical protein
MKIRSTTVAAATLMLFLASAAYATSVCLFFGTAHIVASGLTIPVKGTCASFNGYYANQAGFLLAGDICKSSDGTTVLFNTFTQFSGKPDSLVGKWATSTGSGSGTECNSACTAFPVTVTKCASNVPVPTDLPGFESDVSSTFLTQEP